MKKLLLGVSVLVIFLTSCSELKTTTATQSTYSVKSAPTHTIQTGSRGGQYYINSNGNKTYVKKRK